MLVLDMIDVDWIVKKEKSTGTLRRLSHVLDPLGIGAWYIYSPRDQGYDENGKLLSNLREKKMNFITTLCKTKMNIFFFLMKI